MDMCYDGALVMPGSYTVMSEEEMTYVERIVYRLDRIDRVKRDENVV